MRERGWRLLLLGSLVVATSLLLAPGGAGGASAFPFADKLGHVLLFAGLALVARRAYPDRPRWNVFVGLLLYGAATELAQAWTGRTMDALDFAADALGAGAAWVGGPGRRISEERAEPGASPRR